jgi:hypothetical protein
MQTALLDIRYYEYHAFLYIYHIYMTIQDGLIHPYILIKSSIIYVRIWYMVQAPIYAGCKYNTGVMQVCTRHKPSRVQKKSVRVRVSEDYA